VSIQDQDTISSSPLSKSRGTAEANGSRDILLSRIQRCPSRRRSCGRTRPAAHQASLALKSGRPPGGPEPRRRCINCRRGLCARCAIGSAGAHGATEEPLANEIESRFDLDAEAGRRFPLDPWVFGRRLGPDALHWSETRRRRRRRRRRRCC
jgi:hypothetical protein